MLPAFRIPFANARLRRVIYSIFAGVCENCALHGGRSTGPKTQWGLQGISVANIRHRRQTKDKLAAQRHAAEVGRRVLGELKRLEQQIVDAGLMPDD